MYKDLGSIPRFLICFILFFNEGSGTPHALASTMCYQDLTIQPTNSSDLTPPPWRTTMRPSQTCTWDRAKSKRHGLIGLRIANNTPPFLLNIRPITNPLYISFFFFLFILLIFFFHLICKLINFSPKS